MGPNPIGLLLLRKGEVGHTHPARMPSEDKGRDQDNASTSQGTSKIANEPQKPGGYGQLLPESLRRSQLCWHLALSSAASRTVNNKISVI